MQMDVWTIAWTLVAVVALTVAAVLLFAMRTEKCHAGSSLRRALSAVPPNARMSLAVLSIACAVLAQKGTNEPPRGVSAPYSKNFDSGRDTRPRSGGDTPVQTLTTADYEAGFVLAEARYGDHHDFSPAEGAEICGDWRAFGAACDWFKTDMGGFSFPLGTNVISSLMIYSFGEARAAPRDFSRCIAPFRAPMEIAPESNWPQLTNSQSLFWQKATPTNTYLMTWLNVSLDGSPDHLVSFQAELYADGCVEFRYDLALAGCDVVTNAEAALLSGSGGFCTNGIPAGLTTLRFQRLDPAGASDPDPDGDGISTDDEVFVYRTNPYCADTDYDGLSDYEEIFVYNNDPRDPHSLGSIYCDGLALKLGELDPFSCPEGSTNTVLEHIFYSGTTNGAFAYPQSSAETGVLRVMVTGTGVGEMIVGDEVVPLVAPPPKRSGTVTNILLKTIGKGVRKEVWFRKPEGLDVAIDADDMLIGEMPTLYWAHGWLAFPHTEATVPCIHDLHAKEKLLTLVHGEEFPGLTATWTNLENGVTIEAQPPVSAKVTANFSPSATREISYTVNHPKKLNSPPTAFAQTLRFCPPLSDEEMEDLFATGCDDENEWGHPDDEQEGPDTTSEDEARTAYTNACAAVGMSGVLQLYGSDGRTLPVHLEVPDGALVRCCPCPEHWGSNHVAVAYLSPRLSVKKQNGDNFTSSVVPCTVMIHGLSPSVDAGGDKAHFATNGATSVTVSCTVLGVNIENVDGVGLSRYNELSPSFGFPVTLNTNLSHAARLRIKTDVCIEGGVYRVGIDDSTCDGFEIWLPEKVHYSYDGEDLQITVFPAERLVGGDGPSERYFTARQWHAMLSRYSDEWRGLDVMVLAASTGRCDLAVSYAKLEQSGKIVSSARQRLTAVAPPLLPDYNGDGSIDSSDTSCYMQTRRFLFWSNKETTKGRYVGDVLFPLATTNSANDTVDGDYDMLNFFPLALDLRAFPLAWRNRLSFRLVAPGWNDASFNYCLWPGEWMSAGEMYTNDVQLADGPLSSAHVSPVGWDGAELSMSAIGGFPDECGIVVAEARRDGGRLCLVVKDQDERALFSFALPMQIADVGQLYRWANLRWVCGDGSGEPSMLEEPLWNPDSESDGRHFVFVHGYNVNAEAARVWANQMFKRLWVAGSRSMFTAVDWCGDSSQYFSLIYMDTVSPDYYANVMHAFATASNLVDTVASLPGTNKVMLAHSLGNMLVSSAAVDHGLQYDRYYMLNAAVPMEAYTTNVVSASAMVDSAWSDAPPNYWASGWHGLFETNDFRSILSWRGRFAGIANAVNCYSPTEDVLQNATEHDYGGSWSKQELLKGTSVWHGLNTVLFFNDDVSCEGGWGVNTYYAANPTYYVPLVGFDASVSNLTRDAVIEHPLFTPFRVEAGSMRSTNLFTIADANYRAELRAKFLADAIPATSFAAGANAIPSSAVCGNINYRTCEVDGWPRNNGQWRHSDIKNVAYRYNWMLYRKIINNEGGTDNGNLP